MPERENRNLDPGAEFDLLLRSSLESYADPGPDSGIAERVLARIAAESERGRTRLMTRWVIALPVAACLIIAIVLLASRPLHRPADQTNQASVMPATSSDAGQSGTIASSHSIAEQHRNVSRPVRHSARAAATATAARLPKLDVFPTPQPLTPAEQALVAYVAHVPQAERKSLIEGERRIDAPLAIEALEIKPLELPEPEGN